MGTMLLPTPPTPPNAVRWRIWRARQALPAPGCAALRDGACLSPAAACAALTAAPLRQAGAA